MGTIGVACAALTILCAVVFSGCAFCYERAIDKIVGVAPDQAITASRQRDNRKAILS